MKIDLAPADEYTVYSKGIITSEKQTILTNLYQPIIGSNATILYLTLLNDLKKNESNSYNHHHLMTLMQLKIEVLLDARYRLEAIGLLKTYVKQGEIDKYMYVLYSPLSAYEFFNHPILNIVLYNNIGVLEYQRLQEYYKLPRINYKDYQDITSSFESIFSSSVNQNLLFDNSNIINNQKRSIVVKSDIDMDLLISSIPKRLVSPKCFTDEVKELITNLAYIYKIDNLNMQGLVRNSLNERGLIDRNDLKTNCRNYYQFENNGRLPTLIYNRQPDYLKTPLGDDSKLAKVIYSFENISPYDFLKKSYGNVEPTNRDKKLIENLMLDQKLNPGVINVLIDYVLKVNNKKLNKDYVETIVGQWKRLKVETVVDAMEVCKKEHKKFKKIIVKNDLKVNSNIDENVPSWFNKEQEKNSEGLAELNDVLKEFE
ncbi:MAG: DnaD domain protein [Erysipelotrichaceae bacterium]|nr:DnaD domain protein [Erysipelotrichaceae bacterium]